MTRRNTDAGRKFPSARTNEQGFTLVEILLSVTLLAVVSISLTGYFTTAMDRSMDNTRRVTAANLARMKAEEIKAAFERPLSGESLYRNKYEQLETEMEENVQYQIDDRLASGGGPVYGLFDRLLAPFEPVEDEEQIGDKTVYRFKVSVGSLSADRPEQLRNANAALFSFRPQAKLIRLTVTVYWTAGRDGGVSPPRSFELDTYLVGS